MMQTNDEQYSNATTSPTNLEQTPKRSNATLNELNTASSESHNYLLVKNLPADVDEDIVRGLFSTCKSLKEILIVKNSNNVYVRFSEVQEINQLVDRSEADGFNVNGKKLKMCMVNKLPLDLNEKSKIVLTTVYNEKIEINVHSVYDIFKEFGAIRKIIIFKKKNYQVFIEFESADDAFFFKQALHNINYKGFFFLKIQFTQKKELIVNGNNLYEFDFNASKNKLPPLLLSHSKSTIVGLRTPDAQRPIFGSSGRPGLPSMPLQLSKAHSTHPFGQSLVFPSTEPFSQLNNPLNSSTPLLNTRTQSQSQSKNENIITSLKDLDLTTPHDLQFTDDSPYGTFDLLVSNVNPSIKHKPLFNLFSLYGNIEQITLDPLHNTATITYDKELSQYAASFYLNNTVLFGNTITITVMKEPAPKEPITKSYVFNPKHQSPVSQNVQPESDTTNTVTYGRKKSNSSESPSSQKSMNKPNSVLYIFNISQLIALESIKSLFENFEKVNHMQYLDENRNTAIAYFENTEGAVKTLCMFSNITLLDKTLKMNFASESFLKTPSKSKQSFDEEEAGQARNLLDHPDHAFSKENMSRPNKVGALWTPQPNAALKRFPNF